MMSMIYSSLAMLIGAVIGYAFVYLIARAMRYPAEELNHFLIISCLTVVIFYAYYFTKSMLGLSPMHQESITNVDKDMLKLIIDSTIIYFTTGLLWELYITKK